MNIFITLDYELFFGNQTGTVSACVIKPTQELLKILDPLKIKATFYVDAGYLMALERQKDEFPQLAADYDLIAGQIRDLSVNGHAIQLHIHPHWEDSFYKQDGWDINTSRYRLADFSEEQVLEIVTRYHQILSRISGMPCSSYRAGGWSAQPFEPIGKALLANGIKRDSTAFPGGYYNSEDQFYDFRNIEDYTTHYRFSEDPNVPESEGTFEEIPISAHRVSPLFFWKFVWIKLFGGADHSAFGDGQAIAKEKGDVLRLLTQFSHSVVSIDGFKTSYLNQAYKRYIKHADSARNFVIIGHPKAFTPYSLKQLQRFIESTSAENYQLL
ncbi:hypothetical protein [Gilvibacter sediminis]|uniref:hypothetical protein n=1 Tax=Gilvibacter sediminis TaxID=379071 RepID=UPI002350997F|nr:hypothetical protein [Gilvibacter sediminis]MDC7996785.1 hypothetical protein [Gilvibacter sediminis]